LNPIKCNSKEKKLLKENIESSRILYLKKWFLKKYLFIHFTDL
jgi:hypothetical protein